MLGFSSSENIKASYVNLAASSLTYRFNLTKGKKYYSTGVDFLKINEVFKRPPEDRFN